MAFIQPTDVPISFQGGLQSKTDALQLQPPNLLELINGRFDKIGQLNKRFGYDILTTNTMDGSNITSASAIDVFNNELNLFDNVNIYTYIQANQSWVNRGPAISLINSNNQIIRTSAAQQINPDSCFLDNLQAFCWEDTRGGCRFSIMDQETQAFAAYDQNLFLGAAKPKVVAFNNLFYFFYTDGVNNIYYRTVNPNNPNIITTQTNLLADGYIGNLSYDVSVVGNKLFLAYLSALPSTGAIKLLSLNTNNSINAATTVESNHTSVVNNTAFSALSVNGDSQSNVWVSWSTGVDIRTACLTATATPAIVLADTLVDAGVCPALTGIESTNVGALQLTYEINSLTPSDQQVKTAIIKTDGSITNVGTIRSVGLASKAFRYNNNLFINLTHQSTLQSTYFTAFLTSSPFTIIGKVNYQVGGGLRTNNMLAEVSTISPGIFLWANLVKGKFISEDNVNFSLLGVNGTTIDFTNTNKFNSVTQSNNLLFVGGILQSYDGVSVNEQNFHLYPEDVVGIAGGSDGSLSAGQYQYQVVYAWTDKFGQVQYSTPSIPITVTTAVNNHVVLIIPTLRLTAKTNVVIKVYRTQVNGVVFQEVTSELISLKNNPNIDYVTFTDTVADVDIAGNAPIYTNGGVLSNTAPPSCSLISLYQDRVMLSGITEDPRAIWFSKNKFDNSNYNTIPVEFSSLNIINVSEFGGPITALGLMDDKLIIFKKNAIYVLTGDGPNDLGGGDAFPPPQLISSSIGCTNPNSVILMKDGIMFQSDKGIWLLPRSLGEPQFIGAGVDDQAKQHLISSATIDPNDNLIIFTTYDGNALVYDYYIQQWSEWTNHQSIDGVAFNGLFTFCKPNGQVYTQNRSSFMDGYNKAIIMEFTLPNMSFAGMQNYQRVFRAFLQGTFKGPHQLNVAVAYNFDTDYTQFATIDATTLAGSNLWGSDPTWGSSSPWGGTYQPYEFQINFGRQTCTSLRLKISDSPTSPYNEGYAISNLLFQVGVLPDPNRLPAVNKVGTKTP